MFVLKIVVKLRKTNALNFKQFFYKEMRSVVKMKKIYILKLLIVISLNVYRLFLEKSLMTIIIAYEKFKVIKLLVKEYNVTLKSYFIYVII